MIQIAIAMPESAKEGAYEVISQQNAASEFDTKEISGSQAVGKDLGFDPASVAAAIWLGFKFFGPTAANILVGVVSGLVANEIFRRAHNEANGRYLVVRYSDGTVVEFPMDAPLGEEKIRQILADHGKPFK
ncbi:MAG: hypothetical protein ABJV68_18065 [Paracoccaceae bacterium]